MGVTGPGQFAPGAMRPQSKSRRILNADEALAAIFMGIAYLSCLRVLMLRFPEAYASGTGQVRIVNE